MNYYVICRDDELSRKLASVFRQLAENYKMKESKQAPDVVLSIGGDGTLLHAFHMFADRLDSLSFVGLHTGHLGFFADWHADEIEELARLMAQHKHEENHFVTYPVVEVELESDAGKQTRLALNEFTLKGVDATLVAQININDDLFEMFRGDGICISTPSGSTAYNKSLGGAIIHPSLESMQIAEIASINNRLFRTLGSPVILPRHHHCDIYPKPGQNIQFFVDHLKIEMENIRSIRCRVSDKKVRFARYRPFPFWRRVKEAFISNEEH